MKKQILAILLALTLLVGLVPTAVLAEDASVEASPSHRLEIEGELGEKTAQENAQVPGEYEVTVQVPGASQAEEYTEIIIMADASDSINNAGNWPHFKNMVNALGENLLADHTSLKLTLMGFGIGAKHAGTFTTLEELHAFMEVATSEDFMQERSATNCEVGFAFVEDYLKNSPNIEQTYVIYLSDAAANMTEKKFDMSDWSQYYTKNNVAYIASAEIYNILEGAEPLPVTQQHFPEVCEDVIGLREAYAQDPDSISDQLNAALTTLLDNAVLYGTELTKAVFAMSELPVNGSYSASQMEKIFQTYFRATVGKNSPLYESFMDFFYICFLIPMNRNMPDDALRAAQASLSLQSNEKLLGLYHVCYSRSAANWMNPDYVQENYDFAYTNKVQYLYGADFGQAITVLEDAITEISTTVYKDVAVTDPMSQWVLLEPETISIYYGSTKIYQYGQGWLISEPPVVDETGTAQEPITLALNDKGLYEITWQVKTGNLLISDHYSMRYTVKTNQNAEGYVPGTVYPLNDPTTVSYTDEGGERRTRSIAVPRGVVYAADYQYVSGTPGMALPEGFPSAPVDTNVYADKNDVEAKTPEVLTFADAQNDGVWTFRAWDANAKQIDGGNITFVGEWVFAANPKVPDSSNPDTGDSSDMLIWVLWLMASGAGLAVAVQFGRKDWEL